MTDYTMNEKMIIVQYTVKKFENEEIVIEKLKPLLSEKVHSKNHRHTNWNSKSSKNTYLN